MTYIAVDLWDKRCGIAISKQGIAFPRDIVKRVNVIWYLQKYFKSDEDISHIIVGLPYDLYGTDLRQLDKTQKFIDKIKVLFWDKVVIGHDERFSSFQANEWYSDHRDDIAAQCILQSYLDSISS